ncbi:hypothetical protein DEU56DRAFT_762599, partial [Suillus clintonianus]|uniref:uncharacterized protein n=1 Tax=Suillus clintonianus TaxID=1904413 RepID=UPI001B8806EF
MGRPRLHKTQEESTEAARISRRKYYQRNKERCNAAKQSLRNSLKKSNTDESVQISSMNSWAVLNCIKLKKSVLKLHAHPDGNTITGIRIRIIGAKQSIQSEPVQLANGARYRFWIPCLNGLRHWATLKSIYVTQPPFITIALMAVCRCKLIVAATEELWCYAAVSEVDEDLVSKCQGVPLTDVMYGMLRMSFSKPTRMNTLSSSTLAQVKEILANSSMIFYRWFRLWPPERALFPGIPTNSTLSADQALAVMGAVRRTKLWIVRYFRWAE